ncbi:MAG: BolA family transcriptional regulator [Alphaproteobacteria bacterium]|nr:BolA family transcriptional regulator [Alphaproteobacteria bacterium]
MGRVADGMMAKLRARFQPSRLELIDESARHAGHAGARPDGESHFHLIIVAEAFRGLGRVARQRLVHTCLAEDLAGPVHALSMETRAPEEAY